MAGKSILPLLQVPSLIILKGKGGKRKESSSEKHNNATIYSDASDIWSPTILLFYHLALQGGSGSVSGVMFSNIQVSRVKTPIMIDQFYCDKNKCQNETKAVAVSDINYVNIRGTYTVNPVHFACSDSLPCSGVTLTTIQLKPAQEVSQSNGPFCWETYGQLKTNTIPPIDCLQRGKPSKNQLHSNGDSCWT